MKVQNKSGIFIILIKTISCFHENRTGLSIFILYWYKVFRKEGRHIIYLGNSAPKQVKQDNDKLILLLNIIDLNTLLTQSYLEEKGDQNCYLGALH